MDVPWWRLDSRMNQIFTINGTEKDPIIFIRHPGKAGGLPILFTKLATWHCP